MSRFVVPALAWIGTCAAALLALPPVSIGDEAAMPDHWGPLALLEGSWHGEVDGRLGKGSGVRRYEFLYDRLYLVTRHSSVRLPQEDTPGGDHHREFTVYSYDRERDTVVLREFNVEGFVLEYDCDVAEKRVVCASSRIENGAQMRARMTLAIDNRYRFEETFELAGPGEELAYFLTVRWTRTPDLND